MSLPRRPTWVVLIMLCLPGCATDYYGYTEAQWKMLGAARREAAIRGYDAILKAERDRTHEARFIDPIKNSIIERGGGGLAP